MATIGDKVRVVQTHVYEDSGHSRYDGREGQLIELDNDDQPYKVRFDDGDYTWASKIELVEGASIPASAFDATTIGFAAIREIIAVLEKHGVKVDWSK